MIRRVLLAALLVALFVGAVFFAASLRPERKPKEPEREVMTQEALDQLFPSGSVQVFEPPAKEEPPAVPQTEEPAPPKRKAATVQESPAKPLPTRQALGSALFGDVILSESGRVSCLTCHPADNGYSSKGLPPGLDGKPLDRRAPSLLNVRYGKSFDWDGRHASLEAKCLAPIANKREMGSSVDAALARVAGRKDYADAFRRLYGELSAETLGKCLAHYARSLRVERTRFDDYLDSANVGEEPMTPTEVRGWNLFRGRAECYRCHSCINLTDDKFHNTGIAGREPGRAAVTGRESDRGKFRTPGLRAVSARSHFFHDASARSLEEVIRFYNLGGRPNPNLSPLIRPLRLSAQEEKDLAAFLRAL